MLGNLRTEKNMTVQVLKIRAASDFSQGSRKLEDNIAMLSNVKGNSFPIQNFYPAETSVSMWVESGYFKTR